MENLIGFFTMLDEWAREDDRRKKAAEESHQNTEPLLPEFKTALPIILTQIAKIWAIGKMDRIGLR